MFYVCNAPFQRNLKRARQTTWTKGSTTHRPAHMDENHATGHQPHASETVRRSHGHDVQRHQRRNREKASSNQRRIFRRLSLPLSRCSLSASLCAVPTLHSMDSPAASKRLHASCCLAHPSFNTNVGTSFEVHVCSHNRRYMI